MNGLHVLSCAWIVYLLYGLMLLGLRHFLVFLFLLVGKEKIEIGVRRCDTKFGSSSSLSNSY